VATAIIFGKAAIYRYAGQQLGARSRLGWLQTPFLALFAGTLLFYLLYTIPVLGFVIWGVLVPLGLGAVLLALFGRYRAETASVASAPGSQTSAPDLASDAPENLLLQPRAGFWIRTLAGLLDFILVGAVSAILFRGPRWFLLLWIVYHVGMWSWRSSTIGGVILGLRIIRTNGKDIDFSVALMRCLGAFLSTLALFLGFFWAGWSREKQSWHDKIAGTLVVKAPRRE